MGTVGTDHFLDLERHRQQLEDNVAKIQKALHHWRQCDAEYEELKEEVEELQNAPDAQRVTTLLEQIKTAKREVVTPSELVQLFGSSSSQQEGMMKPLSTITNTLQHRIDYVTKNIKTLEKQLEAAEHKLAVAAAVMDPGESNEEGLPFTDIVEELDEHGNVVTSHLQQPGNLQPQMLEALAKAGIKEEDMPQGGEEETTPAEIAGVREQPAEEVKDGADSSDPMDILQSESTAPIQPPCTGQARRNAVRPTKRPTPKKGVSFAEDTKPGHGDPDEALPPVSQNAKIMADLMEQARQQAIPAADPVIPDDESPEDAEARREMLRYGMTEIAPIVAQLDIDEDDGESDYDDTGSEWDEDEDDEDAYDENGRYKYRVVDDDIHARMRELQEKLGFKSTRELMEADSRLELEEQDQDNGKLMDGGIGRITVTATAPVKSSLKTDDKATTDEKPAKKGVKFANALDVAPDPSSQPVTASTDPKPTFADPMRATIVERAPAPSSAAPTTVPSPKKVSRFKRAKTTHTTSTPLPIREAAPPPTIPAGPFDAPARFFDGGSSSEPRTVPEGPEGKTLADAVVERDTATGVQEPDDFDAVLLQQEAAVEYNRVRNRMIQKDGGFVKDRDAEFEYPEDVDEGGKRLSRFKAARLARQ